MILSTETTELKLTPVGYKYPFDWTDTSQDSQTSNSKEQPNNHETMWNASNSIIGYTQYESYIRLLCVSSVGAYDWLQKAVELEKNGQVDDALDLVFEKLDKYLKEAKFEIINNLIRNIDTRKFTPDVLLTMITVSFPAHDRLSDWNTFLDNVFEFYKTKSLLTVSLNNWFLNLKDE